MASFFGTAILVGGAIGIAKSYGSKNNSGENSNSGNAPSHDVYKDGLLSSREISKMACVNPNQGDCLNQTGTLYVADYPDRQKALVLLQRMESILKALHRRFLYVLDNVSEQDPRYRLQWVNSQGLWARDSTDLNWQLEHIRSFVNRVQNVSIGEVIRQSHTDFTSYTLEKKDLSMCLRDRKTNQIYADNLITYVFLHELGHIMSPSYGHDDNFTRCFRVMLNMALYLNLYVEVDYSKEPVDYCGGVYLNSTVWSRS